MRPNEIAVLENLLELLRRVAWYSPDSRRALFQNPNWKPSEHIFGLLCCPVCLLVDFFFFLFFFSHLHEIGLAEFASTTRFRHL